MNTLSTIQLDQLQSALKQRQTVFRRSTASDPNNLSQLQKGAFLALREINNYIVTGPSTMTFEESQQVYAEILFVSQYLGIRRVLENDIVGFTDKCRSLHLEFMLNDFVDEGLLEFFYSQISSTSRCLISKLIRWKVCRSMIGKEVNLCKIIDSIRNTIGTFLSYDCPLLPTTICIISDSRQKLLDITTSPGVYPEYRRFFTIQRIIKAPPSYVYREFEYYKQISTNQAIFRQLPVSAAKRINCMAISLKISLRYTQEFHRIGKLNDDLNNNFIDFHYFRIADSIDLTNNYQSIMDPQSVLVIGKIKPCKRCEYLYNFNYEEIDAKQMDEYFIMCNCAESEGSIHLEAPQTKSRLQEYTDLIVDFFGNREYLIFISVNLFANFFRRLIRD
ncbi:hypothetical protein RhiirC2_510570 [Rhizophagus irregularis]|uniref:Uncharacterized protein n=1 Tax=Rhizophagus irregularis TaxID=588596 RepID=A0A2N1N5S1_9GLOM|nr:hypothetical protein RhiirC2_510570 [Rhizophagus irregularis]